MVTELIIGATAALGSAGVAGAWWAVGRRALGQHVIRTRTDWVRAGQIVHYGPIAATCYGSRPHQVYRGGLPGALGLTDNRMTFVGHRRSKHNITVRLDCVRWIGRGLISVARGRLVTRADGVMIHYQGPGGWHVATFVLNDPDEFLRALTAETGLTYTDYGPDRPDFGPIRAARLTQDVYGDWHLDRQYDIYLAPDRLLFDWRDPILLSGIRQLDELTRGGWFERVASSGELLRIEYNRPDGSPEVVGIAVRNVPAWSAAIARRIDSPLTIQAGRKKKENG